MKISWVGTNTNQNCGTKILLSAAEAADAEAELEAASSVEAEGALLLDIVVGEGAPVLQPLPLPGEEKPLLIRRNSLLVLNKKQMGRRSTVKHEPT